MKRLTSNKNILTIGLVLLVILCVVTFLLGHTINTIVSQMNNAIISESCLNRFNEMSFEFSRTEQVGSAACDFVRNNSQMNHDAFRSLSSSLLKLDPKVDRIWVRDSDNTLIVNTYRDDSLKLAGEPGWSLEYNVTDVNNSAYRVGIDLSLPKLHRYIAYKSQMVRSYVSIVDSGGVVLFHPDSLLVGDMTADRTEMEFYRKVFETGVKQQRQVISEYLGVSVERIYYPLSVNNKKMIIVVSMPHIVINEEMRDFHRYAFLIMIIAVLLFSVLLAFSQSRWKREYHLRRQAEQEALKLQLQHIVNQINPHFLFNSLNSLYALIGKNTAVAREFVLSLSRVYRHVLESGAESLSTLESEIEVMREYYFLQKIRFNEQIDLRIEIEKQYEAYRLPAMSVQTVVENAIKHNKITPDNPLTISISTQNDRLIIENNYTPREDLEVESLGIGLERLRSIYQLYTQEQIVVSCDNITFRCELPLLMQK